MKRTIPELIGEYLRAAREVIARMSNAYGVDNLWMAYLKGELPQRGPLSPEDGGSYRFHGIGCHFRAKDVDIEIDFGPGGVVGGFDAWRLVYFARHTLGEEFDIADVRSKLACMFENGELTKDPDWGDTLYFPVKQTVGS
jgi:hypothetical protein